MHAIAQASGKLLVTLSLFGITLMSAAGEPCRLEVVEKGSDWPVPLVELRTTHQASFVTDNAGVLAGRDKRRGEATDGEIEPRSS